MLDVSAIIVSYNTAELLESCLSSVLRSQSIGPSSASSQIEVIVVDNSSSDGSQDLVRARFPQVSLVANDSNRGFAAANNQAIGIASGRYVLLLNSDTVVADDAIAKLVAFLDSNPSAAMAGPQLLNPDGSCQHSAFRFPGLLMTLLDFFPLNHRIYNSRFNGRYPISVDGRPFEIDHPLGACMLVRREVIDDIGLLDEQFFMYCEEVDWCMRIKKKGWRIYCVPQAKVVHYGGQSTKQVKGAMYAQLFRSRALLYQKHYFAGFLLAARWITAIGLWNERRRAEARFRAGLLDANQLGEELEALRGARLAISKHA